MSEETKVEFTFDKALKFKKAYEQALESGAGTNETFTFEGNTWVVGYAYYLLQALSFQWRAPRIEARKPRGMEVPG